MTVATHVGTSRSSRYRRAMEGLFIRSEHGTMVPMKFSQSQEIIWRHVAPKLDAHAKMWFIVLKARQIYCLDPTTRILTDDLQWVPLDAIQEGQNVVSVDEQRPHGRGAARTMCVGRVTGKRETYGSAFTLVMSNGERLTATAEHRFLTHRAGRTCWRPVSKLNVGHAIRSITTPWGTGSYEDGWFGGLLDGEGHLSRKRRSGALAAVTQVAGPVLDRALRYLKDRGYTFGAQWDERSPDTTSKLGAQPVCRLQLTRMAELFRMVGQCRPVRFLSARWWAGKELPGKGAEQDVWPTIVAKISLGPRRMIDLSTTTGTFIAEGFVSHNSSTFFQALTFIRTLERPGTHSLVLAHDLFTSHDLFDKSKTFYDHLPLPKIRAPRANELVFPFPNGVSRYRVISAGSVAKGRGTTQTCLHCSEIPSWPHPEIATGLFQSMPDLPDTILVEESTAKGISGPGQLFYEEWNRAVRGESDLDPIFIAWFTMKKYRRKPAIPPDDWDRRERALVAAYGGPHGLEPVPDKTRPVDLDACGEQLAWRRYAIKTTCQNSADNFDQEFPESPSVAFIASGLPAFDRDMLAQQQVNVSPPIWRGSLEGGKLVERSRGEIRIWKQPTLDGEYYIGADTAEGLDGGDYTAAQVLEAKSLEQVASIHGTIQPYEFALMLDAVGRYYNKAGLCIEVYPSGHRVQDHLIREMYYPNLHRWRGKPDRVKLTPAKLYGWETNIWSRPLLLGAGQRALNHNLVTLHEDGLIGELMHFSKNDEGKYEAEVGHDDRVIALLLALRTREENYIERTRGPAFTEELDLPHSVRITDSNVFEHSADSHGQMTSQASVRRRLSKLLKDKAANAAKSWMAYALLMWVTHLTKMAF